MAEEFYSIMTTVGLAKVAAANAGGDPVLLTALAVGDSGGAYFEPVVGQSTLVNERWRGNLSRLYTHAAHDDWTVAEALIPIGVEGGFSIREVGVFDDDGDLIAVGKYPLSEVPALGSGGEKDIYVRLTMMVSNAANVTAVIDSSLAMATIQLLEAYAVPRTRTITAGQGLWGGGDLSEDQAIAMGTPSTCSGNTPNATTTTSHTHVLAAATEILKGVVELATNDETITGADTTRAVHPSGLKAAFDAIFTPENILTLLKTVDGAGSGLDADSLDSISATGFLRSNVDDELTGRITVKEVLVSGSPGFRNCGPVGTYDAYKTDQIWATGYGQRNAADGADFGSLLGIGYKHVYNTTGGTMAGSHQIVFCYGGTPNVALGLLSGNGWFKGDLYEKEQLLSQRYLGITATAAAAKRLPPVNIDDEQTADAGIVGIELTSASSFYPADANGILYGVAAGLDGDYSSVLCWENNTSQNIWYRQKYAGTWGGWVKLYHSGNLGTVQSLEPTGYRECLGGMIEQWGSVTVPANTIQTVTLPIAFPNAHHQCMASYKTLSTGEVDPPGAAPYGLAQIQIANSMAASREITYRAWGK